MKKLNFLPVQYQKVIRYLLLETEYYHFRSQFFISISYSEAKKNQRYKFKSIQSENILTRASYIKIFTFERLRDTSSAVWQ